MEGRVIQVTERAQKTVVGQFHCGPHHNYVMPFDPRIPFEIVIPPGHEFPPPSSRQRQFGGTPPERRRMPPHRSPPADLDGMIVDVEITRYPAPSALPRGRVLEVLGRREDFGVDVEIMIRKFHLPHRFPAEVLAEAERRAAVHPRARPRSPPRLPRPAHRHHRRRDGQGF